MKEYTWSYLWQEVRLLICYQLLFVTIKIAPNCIEGDDLISAIGEHARKYQKP